MRQGLPDGQLRTQRRHGMKIVNPVLFYPWRVFDFIRNAAQWILHVWRYRRMMKRVAADPATASYMDEALTPAQGNEAQTNFVHAFADKILNTYGARGGGGEIVTPTSIPSS